MAGFWSEHTKNNSVNIIAVPLKSIKKDETHAQEAIQSAISRLRLFSNPHNNLTVHHTRLTKVILADRSIYQVFAQN